MNRFRERFSLFLLALAAAAGFGLVTSCNITGGGPSGATGGLNLLLTDGPTDEWQEVTVVLKSVSLQPRGQFLGGRLDRRSGRSGLRHGQPCRPERGGRHSAKGHDPRRHL